MGHRERETDSDRSMCGREDTDEREREGGREIERDKDGRETE